MTQLQRFSSASESDAITSLLACCGSRTWATQLATRRDEFSTAEQLIEASSTLWFTLPEPDWLEAFACHPRIGEVKPASTGFLTHSTAEQLAAQQTLAAVAAQLLEGNAKYEAKFGFLYIVFASGRTAPELLAVLQHRLRNTRAEELQEAARQQDRITRLRIERWLAL